MRGKVIVVNSLLLSKFNYVLGAIDMPDWVLNEIKVAVINFLWRGKGVKISTKTLIADYGKGGLNLVDIDTKRKAIRVKTVKKYLYDKVEYGWKGFFKDWIYKCGGCREHGLLMAFKKPMIERIPIFYQEVFTAWAEFMGNLNYECEGSNQVFSQPIFLNPKIKMNGKVFYNKLFMMAGLRQIKDYVYEYVAGFLPNRAIYDCVCEWDDDIRRSTVDNVVENIKTSIPKRWVNIIERETRKLGECGLPELFIEKN